MTASPATAQPDLQAPWLSEDHWKVGDKAEFIYVAEDGTNRRWVEIVSPAEGTVRDPEMIQNNGVFRPSGKFEHIRHQGNSCAPCKASVLALLAAGQDAWACYWGRWSADAHDRFDALEEHIDWRKVDDAVRGTFAPSADVPDWLRELTAGRVGRPDSPTLCLGQVCEPIDWPALLAEHPGELGVMIGLGWTEESLSWDTLVKTLRMIEAAGMTPQLDVNLEIAMDGALALWPHSVVCDGIGEHPDLVSQVTAALRVSMFGADRWLLT